MRRPFLVFVLAGLGLAATGCSPTEKEHAREQAHQLGRDAKSEAQELKHNIGKAVGSTSTAEAGLKLDRAALLTKVKTKLAADAGLTTVTNVDVDVSGATVTLRGTVHSDAQKKQIEESAKSVDGVEKVVDEIRVETS